MSEEGTKLTQEEYLAIPEVMAQIKLLEEEKTKQVCVWCGHPQDIPRGKMSVVNDGEWTTWSCPDCGVVFRTIVNDSPYALEGWTFPIICCGKRLA